MRDRNVVCCQCRSAVPVEEIQYVSKGADQYTLLCTSCIANPGKVKKNTPASAPVGAALASRTSFAPVGSGSASKAASAKLSAGEMLICTRCKYQFLYKTQGARLHCPYCSKDDRVERYKLDSQSLLDELKEIEESKSLRQEEDL